MAVIQWETLNILDVQLKLYLSNTTMNPCKGVKRKAEAPSLSSWTLYLQAELISGGWHPLFPERVGEDLERDDARGRQEKKRETAESQKNRKCVKKQIQRVSMQWNKEVRRRRMLMMLIISLACKCKTSAASLCVDSIKLKLQESACSQSVQRSYRDGPSWSRRRGCCRRSAWRYPAVWGGSAGGCWGDWLCTVEPQNQTQRRPGWSAYKHKRTHTKTVTHKRFSVMRRTK